MAEDNDQKTEEPSQKRLADAQEKGDVPKSSEITAWFVLAGGTFVLGVFGGPISSGMKSLLIPLIASSGQMSVDGESLRRLTATLLGQVGVVLAVPTLLLVLVALAGHLLQARPSFVTTRLQPKFDKISPIKGFGRVFGKQALVNLIKGLSKLGLVGIAVCAVLWPQHGHLFDLISMPIAQLLPVTLTLSVRLLGAALAILAVLSIADYIYQRMEFLKRNRMTKQEVRDEHRQMEGDPMVKGKIRQIRAERSRQRMMSKVPEATVVVTNPTHYAVALFYESGKMAAPRCVAKGMDHLALRIKAVAEENKVPVVENPPLARALYATVELDQEIPPEHYKAVASVIGYVLRLRGTMSPRPRGAPPDARGPST